MSAANPSLTALMTVYNGGRYLRQAVESVLSQTYSDFEFLIVDDCSSDGSLDVLKSLRDPRIRIISNLFNQGQTRSLNTGLREARGEYVARIDADDVALPNWLERQMEFAKRRPDCVVWSAWAYVIDEEGRVRRLLKVPTTDEGIRLRSLTATPINHGGCLMRREAIVAVGGYREDLKVVADYELWSKLLRDGYKLAAQPIPLMGIRFHGGSISVAKKYDVVARETIEVMRTNMTTLTGTDFGPQKAGLLWKVIYDEENISEEDFIGGRVLLAQIFERIKSEWKVGVSAQAAHIAGQLRAVDGKRALALIRRRDPTAFIRLADVMARDASGRGRAFMMRSAALFGIPGLALMARIFDFVRRQEAGFLFGREGSFRDHAGK